MPQFKVKINSHVVCQCKQNFLIANTKGTTITRKKSPASGTITSTHQDLDNKGSNTS